RARRDRGEAAAPRHRRGRAPRRPAHRGPVRIVEVRPAGRAVTLLRSTALRSERSFGGQVTGCDVRTGEGIRLRLSDGAIERIERGTKGPFIGPGLVDL